MITVCIRKQGGAAVITVPSALLKLLDLEIGGRFELDVKDGVLIAYPDVKPKRYTLSELLKGVNHTDIHSLNEDTLWAREGSCLGKELA